MVKCVVRFGADRHTRQEIDDLRIELTVSFTSLTPTRETIFSTSRFVIVFAFGNSFEHLHRHENLPPPLQKPPMRK